MELLATGFYGWGNPNAKFVFVGKEPGAGDIGDAPRVFADIHQALGRPDLADFAAFHARFADKERHYHLEGAALQPTFGRLIKFLLAFKGDLPPAGRSLNGVPWDDAVREAARAYQSEKFCRQDGETAAIELSALPRRHSGIRLPRNDYVELRNAWIRNFIRSRDRIAVLYYCSNAEHLCRWEAISSKPLKLHEPLMIGRTVHLVTHHPTYPRGHFRINDTLSYNAQSALYWVEMARLVRKCAPGL
jgi:hypothetical protein